MLYLVFFRISSKYLKTADAVPFGYLLILLSNDLNSSLFNFKLFFIPAGRILINILYLLS